MKITLTRVSVLERRKDISYNSAFKALNETKCIVRECEDNLSKREHAVRYMKITFIFEHQIAAIILLRLVLSQEFINDKGYRLQHIHK